jgi:hypothetical protein
LNTNYQALTIKYYLSLSWVIVLATIGRAELVVDIVLKHSDLHCELMGKVGFELLIIIQGFLIYFINQIFKHVSELQP